MTDPQNEDQPLEASGEEAEPELVEEDLVIEEISIDGMCGVY